MRRVAMQEGHQFPAEMLLRPHLVRLTLVSLRWYYQQAKLRVLSANASGKYLSLHSHSTINVGGCFQVHTRIFLRLLIKRAYVLLAILSVL